MDNIERFANELGRPIRPLGIVATKVQKNSLHDRIIRELENGMLFKGKKTELEQPPLFQNIIKQNVNTARGADSEANLRTFNYKYKTNTDAFRGLTREIIDRCNMRKR